MTDCLVPSLLAATRSDDEGFVNVIVTVIIVAIWLIGSLSKARSRKSPSPSETADSPPTSDETASDLSQTPSGTYEEESSTFESPEPPSDETQESFPEPDTTHRPLPSLPGSIETVPMPALPQASADTAVLDSGIAFMESAETESGSMSYSMAGLWTHTDPGEGGNDPIMARLDPDQLRQAIVINEILAEPLSMRPLD